MELVDIDYISVIQSWMDEMGATQADLARKTKRTTGAISLVMTGQRKPSADLLVDIAKALGKPPRLALELAGLIDEVPGYIREAPPQRVNANLRVILHKITVHEDGEIEISWN